MTPKERAVIRAFQDARTAAEVAEHALEQYFRPLVEKTLLTQGVERAAEIVARCPDSVTRALLRDTVSQAALGHLPTPTSNVTHRLTIPAKTKGDAQFIADSIELLLERAVRKTIEPHVGPVRRWDLTCWVHDVDLDAVKRFLGTRAYTQKTCPA